MAKKKTKTKASSTLFSGKSVSYKKYMTFMPIPNKANPYTYLDTVPSEIWDSAEALVNSLEGSFTMSAEERLDTAITFLRTTAAQWQANELAFVENELKKLKEINQALPDPEIEKTIQTVSQILEELYTGHFNYQQFSSAISIVIKGIENYKGRLSNIQANLKDPKSERWLLEGIKEEYINILDLLNNEATWIDEKEKSYEQQVATFVYDYISKNKSKLYSAMLSDGEFGAWLLSLAANFNQFLENQNNEKRKAIKINYDKASTSLENKFSEFISLYDESLMAFTSEDKKILQQIATSMEMGPLTKPPKKREIKKLPKLNQSSSQQSVVFTSNLHYSEVSERMGMLIRNKIDTMLQLGSVGMGDDSLLATLQIGYTKPQYELELNEITNTINNIKQSMAEFVPLRRDREKMAEAYQALNTKIEDTLKNLDSAMQLIDPDSRAFIIHESDKYYKELEEGAQSYSKGFHGRTMSILNYIDIMNSLAQNFGIGDPQLMKFVAYNLSSNSPGADKKSTLEEIFTYVGGMIMFDDIALAVKESIGTLEFSNVTNLHLYKLQELYYPGSYLLFETANYLSNCPQDQTNAAVAEITVGTNQLYPAYVQAFSGAPDSATAKLINKFQNKKTAEEQWNMMRDTMISNTKVSIHFFLNFTQFIAGMR